MLVPLSQRRPLTGDRGQHRGVYGRLQQGDQCTQEIREKRPVLQHIKAHVRHETR